MSDDKFKSRWLGGTPMQEGNRVLLFAMYMTPQGPSVDLPQSADRRFVLKALDAACEDLREAIALDRIRRDIMSAAQAMEAEKARIQVVPANGIPKAG